MNLYLLGEQIKAIVPIIGTSFGNVDDKSTWKVHYIVEPTDEQLLLVQAAIDNFIYDPSYNIITDEQKAIAMLLKLAAPVKAEDIALKDELLQKIEGKV